MFMSGDFYVGFLAFTLLSGSFAICCITYLSTFIKCLIEAFVYWIGIRGSKTDMLFFRDFDVLSQCGAMISMSLTVALFPVLYEGITILDTANRDDASGKTGRLILLQVPLVVTAILMFSARMMYMSRKGMVATDKFSLSSDTEMYNFLSFLWVVSVISAVSMVIMMIAFVAADPFHTTIYKDSQIIGNWYGSAGLVVLIALMSFMESSAASDDISESKYRAIGVPALPQSTLGQLGAQAMEKGPLNKEQAIVPFSDILAINNSKHIENLQNTSPQTHVSAMDPYKNSPQHQFFKNFAATMDSPKNISEMAVRAIPNHKTGEKCLTLIPKHIAAQLDYLTHLRQSAAQTPSRELINAIPHELIHQSGGEIGQDGRAIDGQYEDESYESFMVNKDFRKAGTDIKENAIFKGILQSTSTYDDYKLRDAGAGVLHDNAIYGIFQGFGCHIGFSSAFVSSFVFLFWPFLILHTRNTVTGTFIWLALCAVPFFMSAQGRLGSFWEMFTLTFLSGTGILYVIQDVFGGPDNHIPQEFLAFDTRKKNGTWMDVHTGNMTTEPMYSSWSRDDWRSKGLCGVDCEDTPLGTLDSSRSLYTISYISLAISIGCFVCEFFRNSHRIKTMSCCSRDNKARVGPN